MIADPGLLRNLVPVFDAYPGVACATGRILPKWEADPPAWVLRHCGGGTLGLQNRPEDIIVSPDNVGVYSGHEAVLRDVFLRSGGFNPNVVNGETVGDNERGLNLKIQRLGYRFAYVREAVTHHVIPSTKLTQAYLNRTMAHQGSFDTYAWYRAERPGPSRLATGIVKQLFALAQAAVQGTARLVLGRSSWHVHLAKTYYHFNRARCHWRLCCDDSRRQFVLKDNWMED